MGKVRRQKHMPQVCVFVDLLGIILQKRDRGETDRNRKTLIGRVKQSKEDKKVAQRKKERKKERNKGKKERKEKKGKKERKHVKHVKYIVIATLPTFSLPIGRASTV